jgi:hypothetical protein
MKPGYGHNIKRRNVYSTGDHGLCLIEGSSSPFSMCPFGFVSRAGQKGPIIALDLLDFDAPIHRVPFSKEGYSPPF